MIKLLVFDFDGTLIDSSDDIVSATNELLEKYHIPHLDRDSILAKISHGFGDLIYNHFQRHFKKDTHAEKFHDKVEQYFYEIYENHYLNKVRYMPGALDFLQTYDQLSNSSNNPLKIAILTNKSIAKTLDIVSHLKMDQFSWIKILGRDSLTHYKPHPMPLENIMSLAGVLPSETLMIGDGLPDIGVAKNAGTRSVAVDFGFTPIEILLNEKPDYVISDFDGLKNILS